MLPYLIKNNLWIIESRQGGYLELFGDVKPNYQGLIFSFIIGNVENELKGIGPFNTLEDISNTPTTHQPLSKALSTYIFQLFGVIFFWLSDEVLLIMVSPFVATSTRKSSIFYPLIARLDKCSMSCSFNSIPHFINLAEASGLSNTCSMGGLWRLVWYKSGNKVIAF